MIDRDRLVYGCVFMLLVPTALMGQSTVASADRSEWVPTASSTVVPLQRRIGLDLRQASLLEALDQIGHQAGLQVEYGPDVDFARVRVSLHVDGMTVSEALAEVLQGTRLTAYVSLDGKQILVRMPFPEGPAGIPGLVSTRRQGTAAIAGHVTDAALKAPLAAVSVRIDGTTFATTAAADGRYVIAGIAPGAYHVTARRVGYQPLTKDITLSADQTVTLDFALAAAATRLDEVITTAVGEQRRYQVGNDISTINADSIAPTAPITSLTDLISARAPGVEVLENSGMTGSGEAIRIEGLTSLVLQNDPILIVDGVRQDNSAGGDVSAAFGGIFGNAGLHPTPTRLNDIDFNDIESIDILKGPSASTEYGTDAANGVIVITTKHGTSGQPQWKVSAEQTESDIPDHFPNGYYAWGHAADGTNATVNCTVNEANNRLSESQYDAVAGNCVIDSVTRWSPFNHAATSIFGTGDRGKYDLSVSGGSDAIRYFVSGGLSDEVGLLRVPSVFKEFADTAGLGLPSSMLNPNSEQQRSVRLNSSMRLSSTADLTATGSYLSTYQDTPNAGSMYVGAFDGPALPGAAHFYGYDLFGEASRTPLAQLSELGSQNTDRLTGGLTANWRPSGWFVGHATAGLDHGSQMSQYIDYPLANTAYEGTPPSFGLGNTTTDIYSVDIRGTATASITRGLRSVTSGGAQMVDTRMAGQTAVANDITSTNLTLNGATAPSVTQIADRQATLGGYGEEELSFADRLFLTGALRVDAGSGFGRQYATAAYPKASVSWLALTQGQTTVRVRGAFGESGVQPTNGAALVLYTPQAVYLNGSGVSASGIEWPGNPNLQPERTEEFEGGVDIGGWENRVSLELTGYSKLTHDALVNQTLGWDAANYTYQQNIGEVRNTGVEGSATIGVIQSRSVTWTVGVNASVNHNKLVSLAPGVLSQQAGGTGFYRIQYVQAAGYPLYGIWADRVTYADVNHDGIIEPGEITIADSTSYVGQSLPTQEASLSTHIGLLHGSVTVGGLVDYRGGYRIVNLVAYSEDDAGNSIAENSPTAPLWLQARAAASATYPPAAPFTEDGTFIRFRELSLTYTPPHLVIRALRMQSLSLTAAVRNLALWTRYTGVDPEVSNSEWYDNVQYTPTSNSYTINNDVRMDAGTVPLARYWVLRLNVGL